MSRRKKLKLKVSYGNYSRMVSYSLAHPAFFCSRIAEEISSPKFKKIDDSLYFFITNLAAGSLLGLIVNFLFSPSVTVLFLGISGIVFITLLGGIALFVLSGSIYLIHTLLGGKLKFRKILIICAYSSSPILFLRIPLVSIFSYFYLIFLLITLIYLSQKFYLPSKKVSLPKTAISVVTPFLSVTLLLILLQFISLTSLFALTRF